MNKGGVDNNNRKRRRHQNQQDLPSSPPPPPSVPAKKKGGKAVAVINLDSDSDEGEGEGRGQPAVKKVTRSSYSSSSNNNGKKRKPGPGGEEGEGKENHQGDHHFAVPSAVAPPAPKRSRKKSSPSSLPSTSAAAGPSSTVTAITSYSTSSSSSSSRSSLVKNKTVMCRDMRSAIVVVLRDFHMNLKRNGGGTGSQELAKEFMGTIGLFVTAWKKVPLAFTSNSSLPLLSEGVDNSSKEEIKDFMQFWIHGLASLLLIPELQRFSPQIISFIKTCGQLLSQGNPELMEDAFLELLDVISKLVTAEEGVSIYLRFPLDHDQLDDTDLFETVRLDTGDKFVVIRMPYEIHDHDVNKNGIDLLLEVLGVFLPQPIYFNPLHKHRLMYFVSKMWRYMNNVQRLKLLSCFFLPILPLMDLSLLPMEIQLVDLMQRLVDENSTTTNPQRIFEFHKFLRISEGYNSARPQFVWNFDLVPSTALIRLHSFLSSFISGEGFISLPSDLQRSGVTKLYLSLLNASSRRDDSMAKYLGDKDVSVFEREAGMPPYTPELYFMLESVIFKNVQIAFDRRSARMDAEQRGFRYGPQNPGKKDVKRVELHRTCSPLWQKCSCDLESILNSDEKEKSFIAIEMDLMKSCFLIRLISNVNRRIIEYATKANHSFRNLIFLPDNKMINEQTICSWVGFLHRSLVLLNDADRDVRKIDSVLHSVLDAIDAFCNGSFSQFSIAIKDSCKLFCIAALPWIHKVKTKLTTSQLYFPDDFLEEILFSASATVLVSNNTKLKCLKVLSNVQFLLWEDLGSGIILDLMEDIENLPVIKSILKMISDENWIIRSVPWKSLVAFLYNVQRTHDWQQDAGLRNLLVSAIVKLPCLLANKKTIAAHFVNIRCSPTGNSEMIKLNLKNRMLSTPCLLCNRISEMKPICTGEGFKPLNSIYETDESISFIPLPEKSVKIILQLSLPFTRSRFRVCKISICNLLRTIRCHTTDDLYDPQLITEFSTMAAKSGVYVGQEIMRGMSIYLKPELKQTKGGLPVYRELRVGDDRAIGISLMFDTLLHHLHELIKNIEGKDSKYITFSTKLLVIFKELTLNPDDVLITEIIRFSLRLILFRDSILRNTLAQSICVALAHKANPVCAAPDLLARLRYQLSPTIIKLIREYFCDFTSHTKDIQKERVKAFFFSISVMGGYQGNTSFMNVYAPLLLGEIIPNIDSDIDPSYKFILECVTEYSELETLALLQNAFPVLYRVLVLDCRPERTNSILKYLNRTFKMDTGAYVSYAAKATLNEMLFFLSERKEKVEKFIAPFIPGRSPGQAIVATTLQRSQLQELLGSSLMEIFIHLDAKMHSRSECVSTKRRMLKSFTILMKLVGKARITKHKAKIYTSLNSLFSLGPDFYNLLYEAWECFATNLEDSVCGALSSQILSAVCTFHPYFSKEVDSLIAHFVLTKKEITLQYYPQLYFVTDFCKDDNIIKTISSACHGGDGVSSPSPSPESWLKMFQLYVKESSHENAHVRTRALVKVHSLLSSDYDTVVKLVLEREHPVVSEFISSFISISRDADHTTLMRLAEGFGLLGAVDPYRFRNPKMEQIRGKGQLVFLVDGIQFVTMFLDVLIREFQEANDTTDFDYCACLIQQVLKHYNVQNTEGDPVWKTLSDSAKRRIEPLLKSKYQMDMGLPRNVFQCPIYLSEDGKNFEQWLRNWFTQMSMSIPKENACEGAYELFNMSRFIVTKNTRIASFLLPHVATYVVLHGSNDCKSKLREEIDTILKRWIDQEKNKSNSQSQMMMMVKESQASMDSEAPEPEAKVILDEEVIQYRCTQEIFSVYDHLFRVLREADRQLGMQEANEILRQQQQAKGKPSVASSAPSLTPQGKEKLRQGLKQISLDTVSQVSFHCEDYERALFYIEQDLKEDPTKLQDKLPYLQKLYVSLNDLDSVRGVAAIRIREPTSGEVVSENFLGKKVEEGLRSLEFMADEDSHDLLASRGLLQAYLSLDEPRKAETLIKGSTSRNPHWGVALEEFQLEAAWKLRRWDILDEQVNCSRVSNLNLSNILVTNKPSSTGEAPPVWTSNIVKILSFVRSLEIEMASELINEARLKLMNPLIAAANDYNAYTRGYASVVQLHILTEVEQVINFIIDMGRKNGNLLTRLKKIINGWKDRENILLKSQKFFDPVLNVRKSLLEILKDMIDKHNSPEEQLLNSSIRDCWLTAASVERKAGNFTRALNCVQGAKKYMSPEVMIEHVKLLHQKGEKEQALKILETGILNYFPKAVDWKNKAAVGGSTSDIGTRELCSKALLLEAKLKDELHQLDNEKNIKNYEACTNVFKNSEKNFFVLAGYFDRLYNSSEDKAGHAKIQESIVKYYAESLHYGCRYVFQSLPRLLQIWLDFAALQTDRTTRTSKDNMKDRTSTDTESLRPADWNKVLSKMNDSIRTLIKEVPSFILLTAFSQLTSRILHENSATWELLKEIIVSVMATFPHQGLWKIMVHARSTFPNRSNKITEITKMLERKQPNLKKVIAAYIEFGNKLDTVCLKSPPNNVSKCSMKDLCPTLPDLVRNQRFGDILIPFHMFLNPSVPQNGCHSGGYNAFPQSLVFIRTVEDNVDIFASVQKPKRIVLVGSNGKRYSIMCKKEDDLRLDQKVVEINDVINFYLRRNSDSRERNLYVRVYAVTPISEKNGIMEFVPNLRAFRTEAMNLYKDKGKPLNLKTFRTIINDKVDTLEVRRNKFLTKMVEPYPPVFSEWFINNFNDPQSWYKARMAYCRTTAVMSVVGFVLGLGDRHGENINLDHSTGDVVHVDFNCLFNKGETFAVPERVPFRLTQNMINGMGPLGTQGVFRRSCETTLDLFRQHKEVFLSVLRPLAFDPLVEWDHHSAANKWHAASSTPQPKASEQLKRVRQRIEGTARNYVKTTNAVLSVESHVSYLIDEATSPDNLCQMFHGWTPWL